LLIEAPDLLSCLGKVTGKNPLDCRTGSGEFVPGEGQYVYNGSCRSNQRLTKAIVRVIFENHLPEMTSIHWHGEVTIDGKSGLRSDPVMPGRDSFMSSP
jgi:hypothetical protein